MDKKIIEKFGTEIYCYKLRTARQKKRMQYEDFDKQLIQLHKKQKALDQLKYNLGWKALNPPVQKGWVRNFVVREDVARSKYGEFFEGILKKINTSKYSWKKDFTQKKKRRGKKIYVVRGQHLLMPGEYCFSKMKFTDLEKQFFTETWELGWNKQLVKKYVFTEPWRFVLKTMPNMIDKERIIDGVLESEIKELDNYLERNDFRKRLGKVVHGRFKWKRFNQSGNPKEWFLFKNKSLTQILDAVNNE